MILNISRYFAYAQGVPLLIVIITAIVDSQAPDIESGGDTRYFPNMGIFGCFVGYSPTVLEERAYFVQTPEFIYFYVYLVIIQIANIYFFAVASSSFILKADLRYLIFLLLSFIHIHTYTLSLEVMFYHNERFNNET